MARRHLRPQVTATDDLDVAEAALSEAYTELTLRAEAARGAFSMRLQSVELPDMTLATVDLSRSTVTTAPYPTYTVCLPVRGEALASAGAAAAVIAGERGIVASPGSGAVRVEYEGDRCRVATVTFTRWALEAELDLLLGRPAGAPVHFDLSLDLAACGSFRRALELLRAELAGSSGAAAHPHVVTRVGRLVMAGLLLGQPHQFSEELQRPARFEGPAAIRRAVAAIEERPTDIATVADIAAVAHLSVRALEDGFRRHLAVSPMAYLRQVRLARAHDELASSCPEATTATSVAHRWGFAHYGRFAALYRQRYGCTPSETLRSSARPPGRRPGKDRPEAGGRAGERRTGRGPSSGR